jgi:type IV pilus assembly protein PilC
MTETGERTGRLEDTFSALSEYYDNRQRLHNQIRNSLLYPCILMILILTVIVVVLVKVMPVFSQVYAQLGVQMTGLAGGLLKVGTGISGIMPVLVILLVLAAVFIFSFAISAGFSNRLMNFWRKMRGDRGAGRKINAARFASALSIGMASGLPIDESLELAASFSDDVPDAAAKYESCRQCIAKGESLAEALKKSGIFSAMYCQMISIGVRSGSGASAVAEAARRMEAEAENYIERRVRSIEPAMVINRVGDHWNHNSFGNAAAY